MKAVLTPFIDIPSSLRVLMYWQDQGFSGAAKEVGNSQKSMERIIISQALCIAKVVPTTSLDLVSMGFPLSVPSVSAVVAVVWVFQVLGCPFINIRVTLH